MIINWKVGFHSLYMIISTIFRIHSLYIGTKLYYLNCFTETWYGCINRFSNIDTIIKNATLCTFYDYLASKKLIRKQRFSLSLKLDLISDLFIRKYIIAISFCIQMQKLIPRFYLIWLIVGEPINRDWFDFRYSERFIRDWNKVASL